MIGFQQAKIIGVLRIEYEKDPKILLTVKDVTTKYAVLYPTSKPINYKTIATILHRLADQKKIVRKESNHRLKYRYKNIEEEEISNLLKIFVQSFGTSGLTHLADNGKNLIKKKINDG